MRPEDIKRVLVIGAGTMGPEVAAQCGLHGLDVVVHDIDPRQLAGVSGRVEALWAEQVRAGRATPEQVAAARPRIATSLDPAAAAHEVDVISECVSENLKLKRQVLARFSRLCPARTIVTTGTSYFLPSMLMRAVERPERFAAWHFHVPAWYANAVDIMPHPGTAPETVHVLERISRGIGQVPIVARKENHGYVFNAMLRELLAAALGLAAGGVASVEDVDRAWMVVTKMGIGPFGLIDNIGLDTVHDIVSFWGAATGDPRARQNAEFLAARIAAAGRGMKSGSGFYTYPNPAFTQPGFLSRGPAPPSAALPAGGPPEEAVHRFVIAPSTVPALPPAEMTFHGPVLVLGDNEVARSLCRRLRAAGAEVRQHPGRLAADGPGAAGQAGLEGLLPRHVFVLTPLDPETFDDRQGAAFQSRYAGGVLGPYFVLQRWFKMLVEQGLLDQATLVAGSSLGGDFGCRDVVVSAEGGGMAGLLKSISMEGAAHGRAGPQVKCVDLAGDMPPDLASACLMAEAARGQSLARAGNGKAALHARFAELEVGYSVSCRRVLRLIPAPLGDADRFKNFAGDAPDGAWLITGGARGITALVARALAERFGIHLHLVGRTTVGDHDFTRLSEAEIAELKRDVMKRAYAEGRRPNEAWAGVERRVELQRTLADFRAAGLHATYHACDAGDMPQLEATVRNVRAAGLPIRGVLHGAGLEVTGRFETKARGVVEATLAAKVIAMHALEELTRSDPLRWLIAFGSLSGRFGGVGQTEYAMANEMLAKQVQRFRRDRPDCRSLLIHWPGWAEVGMAARPASQASLRRIGHRLLPPDEGIRHLLREIAAGAPDGEVVFVNRDEIPPLLVRDRP